MSTKIIGLYGGRFDPVHNGHINVAKLIIAQTNVTEIQFIPVFHAPHNKTIFATPEQRLTMLELALQKHANFSINNCEIQRQGTSYTYDTVNFITTQQPQHTYYLIIGMDAFNDFNQWHRWQDILSKVKLLIANRPHHSYKDCTWQQQLLAKNQAEILNLPEQHYSATHIRNAIQQKKSVADMLSTEVLDYIRREHMYQS